MPKYKYVAVSPDGQQVKGSEDAPSRVALGTALLDRELIVQTVAEKKSVLSFEITRKKVPRQALMHFSRQLAVFLKAGVAVLDGLEIINEETSNKVFKRSLDDMIEALKAGDSFAGAAAAHPEAFPPFYIGVLSSAELTGNLDTVLDQLADYIDRDIEAKRKVIAALIYPAVVAVMSVGTVIVLTTFVLPKFQTFFASLNAKLPLPTRMLLAISHFVSAWGVVIGIVATVLIVGAGISLRTGRGRDLIDTLILKLPVLGDLVTHSILERFCRILSSMVRAGVPLPEALTVTSDGTNNAVYKKGLKTALEAMLRGEGLARPLADTGLFPAAARQMFRVGEDTGTLDQQLETAAVYFDRELDYRLKKFTNLFEPAVIIFMGGIVGFVAIALVSAMYGIFRQVKT